MKTALLLLLCVLVLGILLVQVETLSAMKDLKAVALSQATNPSIHQFAQSSPVWVEVASPAELDRLFAVPLTIHGIPVALWFRFLYLTGCRKSESLSLTWADVDETRHIIRIHSAVTKASKRREIPLTEELLSLIYTLPEPHTGRLWPFSADSGYLGDLWRKSVAQANVPRLRLHNLRDTAAVHWIYERKLPIPVVCQLLGHSSIDVTYRNYVYFSPEELRELVSPK